MEGEITAAGTIVAAFLEHSGYLLQARLLEKFQSFFRDAGAFIYLISGIGAVVSITLYGSFRAVRYLLIGPALFWFLVGPTISTRGVLAKMGDGDYLAPFRETGEAASEGFRTDVQETAGQKESRTANVALGFYLFAGPINEFVNEFVGVVLDKEDTEDKTAMHKARGLELIAAATVYETAPLRRLTTFGSHCGRTLTAATGAASALARIRAKQKASGKKVSGGGVCGPGDGELEETCKEYLEQTNRLAYNIEFVEPVINSGFEHIIRAIKGDPDAAVPQAITCAKAWEYIALEIWNLAKRELPWVLDEATGQWKYSEAKGWTCEQLTKKLLDSGGTGAGQPASAGSKPCNIHPGVAMAMIHNQLQDLDYYGQIMKKHWNDTQALNPASTRYTTGIGGQGQFTAKDGNGNSIIQNRPDEDNINQKEILKWRYIQGSGKRKASYQWTPATSISMMHGMDHSMWVATRRFELARLRQETFTFAMQLPYYQGTLLYFMATAYPFLALIVLLPGRAHNFLSVPLAWLWVKSWDIGFAVVITLDKIMYNALPDWRLHEALHEGPWKTVDQFVQVLGEGFDFDPLSALHMYYAVLSTVSLAVPILTGAVVLRSRRGILASFTDAPRQQALDRGASAGTAFSLVAQNKRNRMMLQIDGAAQMAALGGVGKVNGGSKRVIAQMARSYESLAQLAKTGRYTDAANPVSAAKKMMKANESGIERAMKIASMEAEHERMLFSRYDKQVGRGSISQQMHEAGSSAMDDGTGYELSRHSNYGYSATLKAMTGKLQFALQNYSEIVAAVSREPARLGKDSIGAVFSSGNKSNYAEVMLFGSAAFGAMLATDGLKDNEKAFNMETLKKFFDAEAYSDEEILARAFHLDRFVLKDPTVRASFMEARDSIGAELFDRFFGVLVESIENGDQRPPPGGATHSIDIYLSAAGGDRWIGPAPNELARHMGNGVTPQQIQAAMSQSTRLNKSLEGLVGLSDGAAELAQYFANNFGVEMRLKGAEYRKRLEAEVMMQRMFAGGHAAYENTVGLVKESIYQGWSTQQASGAERMQTYWNAYDNGAGINGQQISLDQAENLSEVQLAQLMTKRQEQLFGDMVQKAKLDNLPLSTRLDIAANLNYRQLPADLAMLAENNPLTAMQMIQDWLRVTGPNGNLTTQTIGTSSDVISHESEIYMVPKRKNLVIIINE